eukprot:TRINITY_DN42871_c0_g1_i1.p1 TRINITY_DN42871_c0_g1~~TRINITY_DN42871_c0_g1_i1.p1  ORF type:complete len:347 (+),score=48.04 TRINITY_DN42871_c0_g1_i1:217-1257(+)
MVGMSITFGIGDFQTVHGGPPFHGWKRGYGFGHARGPGEYMSDQAMSPQLRFTPGGDRAMASSAFWRRRAELGQASSFGIGDRPSFMSTGDNKDVGPESYGDVTRTLQSCRRNCSRSGITLKPKFPSMEQKYREKSTVTGGPGPAKYNTSATAGQPPLTCPAKVPSFSMQGRGAMIDAELRQAMERPAPNEYRVQLDPGKKSPVSRSCVRDVTTKYRFATKQMGEASPGPARYTIRGHIESYTLGQKIQNVAVPPEQLPRGWDRTLEQGASRRSGQPLSASSVDISPSAAAPTADETELQTGGGSDAEDGDWRGDGTVETQFAGTASRSGSGRFGETQRSVSSPAL